MSLNLKGWHDCKNEYSSRERLNHLHLIWERPEICSKNDKVQKIGLTINFIKTKMMSNMVPSDQIQINNYKIEQVYRYVYLDHEITITRENQICKLNRRITLGWGAHKNMSDPFKSNIPICLERKTCNQFRLPVLNGGTPILTLIKKTTEKLKVTLKRMERRIEWEIEKIRRRTGVGDIKQRINTEAHKWSWCRTPTWWTNDLKGIATNLIATARDRENWRCFEEACVH